VPDYGHELEFGVFLGPDAAAGTRALELAQLTDVLGYDLVTVQDHPYQAKHLDALTLLAMVAARTSAVRVAPNVANLPLRPPAVLAQAIASLDVLSDGRAELGLGAGAFWDAIVAAGGPRRTPGEAVEALEEAIAVIRGVWGLAGNRSVDVDGSHYTVKGLHAGPSPLHDVQIWLGALKPRMLRLTGRLADGWLPSLGRVTPENLAALNEVIDEAAENAGRGPLAVRRMLNVFGGHEYLRGSTSHMAERLAALTLDHGTSTFILGTDDPDELRRFAAEVAPAVRELVAAERGVSSLVEPGERQRDRVETSDTRTALPTPTPDDGRRLSGTLPWDESTRPTYAGPADVDGTRYQQPAVPQHLVDIHDHLRGELATVRDLVDQVRRGAVPVGAARSVINTMTMRQNNWTLGAYCESYCRIVTGHHSLEDHSVFTHLRRSEPDLGAVLDRLQEEHVVIHDVLDQVDDALVGLVGAPAYGTDEHGATAALDELQRAIDLLTDTLLSHLSYEERELIEPLARHGFS
jgi:alkanesulfonate monooxygenase SsuD/methylene tetrahydromethanopterin reductase-like flavin-dependent oxidoreductase (luciferase family)